jgi:hypothetical protein
MIMHMPWSPSVLRARFRFHTVSYSLLFQPSALLRKLHRTPLLGEALIGWCSRGITLPPLLFLSYLDLTAGQTSFTVAWTRFIDITIGIVAAILVGTTVWPNHARVRYFRSVSSTLEQATEYCQ